MPRGKHAKCDRNARFAEIAASPVEGGYFAETYRSNISLHQQLLPSGYPGNAPLVLKPDGTGEILLLGQDILRGMRLRMLCRAARGRVAGSFLEEHWP